MTLNFAILVTLATLVTLVIPITLVTMVHKYYIAQCTSLLAPSGALVFIMVYYIPSAQPLFQIFQRSRGL